MENSDLKERVKNNVKERIAISNMKVRMKKNESRKVIYLAASVCATIIICAGIIINSNTNKPETNIADSANLNKNNGVILDNASVDKDLSKNDIIIFNDNSLGNTQLLVDARMLSDIDGRWEDLEIESIQKFLDNIDLPNEYKLSRKGKVYVREDLSDNDYSKFRQYHLIYLSKQNSSTIEIIFTKEDTILQCPSVKTSIDSYKNSIISGKDVKLFKYTNFENKDKIDAEALFNHGEYLFYIDSYKVDENDFINVVKSVLEQEII